MSTLQPTTKHSHWQKTADLKGGQYFKRQGHWYLAPGDVKEFPDGDSMVRLYRWTVQAYGSDGFDRWIGIYRSSDGEPEMIEVSDEGKRPKSFTPATLRRKAGAQREEAERQVALAWRKEQLARRLEEGSVAG